MPSHLAPQGADDERGHGLLPIIDDAPDLLDEFCWEPEGVGRRRWLVRHPRDARSRVYDTRLRGRTFRLQGSGQQEALSALDARARLAGRILNDALHVVADLPAEHGVTGVDLGHWLAPPERFGFPRFPAGSQHHGGRLDRAIREIVTRVTPVVRTDYAPLFGRVIDRTKFAPHSARSSSSSVSRYAITM